ncbi:MAG: phage late control D family protein, partial [Myxococcota bacterium]
MDIRLIDFEDEDFEFFAEAFHFEDSIGELYTLSLVARCLSDERPASDFAGVLIEVDLDDDGPFGKLHGVIMSARKPIGGSEGGGSLRGRYELTIRPPHAVLTQTRHNRIFQQRSVVDIVEDIFQDYPILPTPNTEHLRARDEYPEIEFKTQYAESDYDFMVRVLAEWGILWFFRHSEDASEFVLIDQTNTAVEVQAFDVVFNAESGGFGSAPAVTSAREAAAVRPGVTTFRGYDQERPDRRPEGAEEVA